MHEQAELCANRGRAIRCGGPSLERVVSTVAEISKNTYGNLLLCVVVLRHEAYICACL